MTMDEARPFCPDVSRNGASMHDAGQRGFIIRGCGPGSALSTAPNGTSPRLEAK